MLSTYFFTFNPFQENTYLIINDKKECWVVDPGMYDASEITRLTGYIEQHQLQPQGIINTHTHIDHIFGVQFLTDTYNIPFGIHEKDLSVLNGAAETAALFGLDLKQNIKPSFYIKEGEPLMLGDEEIDVLLAPGHSPGSVVFYYPAGGWAIGGDVLFSGSVGRTDLPGGSMEVLLNSIRTQLFTLPEKTIIYPGHGPATTIGAEIRTNPFLQ
jgi:hydroxyacylglutathione hydrolase